MKVFIAAAFALAAASSLPAQTTVQTAAPPPATPDFTYAIPIAGSWTFAPAPDGSAATFLNASAMPQLTVRCVRSTRRGGILKPGGVAGPVFHVWASTERRRGPGGFGPAAAPPTIPVPPHHPVRAAL